MKSSFVEPPVEASRDVHPGPTVPPAARKAIVVAAGVSTAVLIVFAWLSVFWIIEAMRQAFGF